MMTLRMLSAVVVAAMLSIGCSDDNDAIVTGPTATSTEASVSTASSSPQGGCSRPDAPTLLRVTAITGTSVELTWEPVAGATSYSVVVGTTQGGSDVLSNNVYEPTIRFTAPDGRSFARVDATSACGSGQSAGVSFVVP